MFEFLRCRSLISKPTFCIYFVLILFGFLMGEAEAGTVKGSISVDGGKKLSNIIIYMEPTDGQDFSDGKAITISQKDSAFEPAFNVIVKGRNVLFSNDEVKNIDHNVYSLSKQAKFDIGLNGKGTVKEVPFNAVGTFKFYCSVHKSMEGVLGVVPTPYFAKLAKPGAFTINNVPPGKWVIKAMISHRRYSASPIDQVIAEGEQAAVQVQISKKSRKKKETAQLAMTPVDIIIPAEGPSDIIVNLIIGESEKQEGAQ